MSEPRWLSRLVVDAVHHDQITTHGGMPGLRDAQLLEFALTRLQQLYAYSEVRDIPALAAAYAYGFARNHPYHDGNKRIAFITMAVFAELNGWELDASETEVVEAMLLLAAGEVDEEKLTDWLRRHLGEVG